MTSTFEDNWDFGEMVKHKSLKLIIISDIKKILNSLKKQIIKQSSKDEDMRQGIDFILDVNVKIAFRGRRVPYKQYASDRLGGSFTFRATGRKGGKAEIYKMKDKEFEAEIYVFVWSCGTYAVLNVPALLSSGLIEDALENKGLRLNKNPRNGFYSFTLTELRNANCIINFHDPFEIKTKKLSVWF